ncbi:lipase 1-like [Anopheles aquasalis]|uniref:lipase 1-like n=1 Tax=Anopheles aquasalis TaxID=42839 RepID=UPI00215B3881|nr:lipase 1-like [Anopheles aquasalis]
MKAEGYPSVGHYTFALHHPHPTDNPQITSKYGYTTEVHNIVTEDGYIIELHRLRASPKFGPANASHLPVLLMHGLMGSSADWIFIGPQESLPYLLSDRGHDVWLGNARGNRYSRNHTHLSPEEREFWDFSFDEIGRYDLPAMVDHVLTETGHSKLHYVGHSQGTTIFFVLNAERPEYNRKFELMQALAPAVFMENLRNSPLRFLAQHEALASYLLAAMGIFEMKPFPKDWTKLVSAMCPDFIRNSLCLELMHAVTSNKYLHFGTHGFPMVLNHLPAGSSIKQWSHFGQEVMSGHFRRFDYGPERNRQQYGSEVPPNYNLSRVTVPVAINYGLADELVHPVDVRLLAETLPNLVTLNQQANATFNHMDFLAAGNVKDVLYDSLIRNVEQRQPW